MKWFPGILAGLMLGLLSPTVVGAVVGPERVLMASTSEGGWVAHSAYGLQLSVPASWHVAYFQNCPDGGPGNLLIGTPLVYAMCLNYPESLNIVTMQPSKSEARLKNKSERSFVIDGLHVTSETSGPFITWAIPSKNVVITAMGNHSNAVLHTLAKATPKAQAAFGVIKGTESLQGATTVPVTGLISVIRLDAHGPAPAVARSFGGTYTEQLPPGRYRLTGHDGDAACPVETVIVSPGLMTAVPPIVCQGI